MGATRITERHERRIERHVDAEEVRRMVREAVERELQLSPDDLISVTVATKRVVDPYGPDDFEFDGFKIEITQKL